MTSETVYAQGSAKLEECSEENCVIVLGNKIGADYIVRGIISKLGTNITLSVEMYETEDGNLVATSGLVRAETVEELVVKATDVCANMYKTFVSSQSITRSTKFDATEIYSVTVNVNPANGGYVTRSPNKTLYDAGEPLMLTATVYDGYEFTGWSGTSTSTKATIKGIVNDDMVLTANFQYIRQTYTLTTTAFPQGSGYVTRNPDKEAYAAGEAVTVLATHENGYRFINWTGAASSRTNYVTVRMDGDKTLTANFYRQVTVIPPSTVTADNSAYSGTTGGGTYIIVSAPMFATPALGGELAGIEIGWFGDDKVAYGFEFGGGVWGDAHNTSDPLTGVGRRETVGGGFNISRMGERWVLGWSTGYWYGRFELENYTTPLQEVHVFGGPFVKLRYWKIFEIGYRGLLGYKQDGTYNSYNSMYTLGKEKELMLASQFKFGLHFDIKRSSTQRSEQTSMPTYQSGSSTFTDNRDGKTYRTVGIGDKTWMAENLNITLGNSWYVDNENTNNNKHGLRDWTIARVDNENPNDNKYGRLYDWTTARTACPQGWHLPSREEWGNLAKAVGGKGKYGMRGSASKTLKARSGWAQTNGFVQWFFFGNCRGNNCNGTDDYGFSALPGGVYVPQKSLILNPGKVGAWWTDTEYNKIGTYTRAFMFNFPLLEMAHQKNAGLSVRCVQD